MGLNMKRLKAILKREKEKGGGKVWRRKQTPIQVWPWIKEEKKESWIEASSIMCNFKKHVARLWGVLEPKWASRGLLYLPRMDVPQYPCCAHSQTGRSPLWLELQHKHEGGCVRCFKEFIFELGGLRGTFSEPLGWYVSFPYFIESYASWTSSFIKYVFTYLVCNLQNGRHCIQYILSTTHRLLVIHFIVKILIIII